MSLNDAGENGVGVGDLREDDNLISGEQFHKVFFLIIRCKINNEYFIMFRRFILKRPSNA
jgi:hypothetical protein